MSNYGMKVSQAGYDVLTADKERLIFSSKYDTFKVHSSGSGTIAVAAATDWFTPRSGTVEITHSLGYKPAFFVFSNNPIWVSSARLAPYIWRSIGAPGVNQPNYGIDTSKLYITFWNPDADYGYTFEYRYYIFYNQLST